MLDFLIPMEDQEMGIELEKAFKRQKIAVHTKSRVTKISDDETGLKKVTFIDPDGDEQEVTAEQGRLFQSLVNRRNVASVEGAISTSTTKMLKL